MVSPVRLILGGLLLWSTAALALPYALDLPRLQALEPALAGDPDYDYALALSALTARQPAKAIAPLERVLLRQPDFAGAWLDLVLAYHQLGDADTAWRLLDQFGQRYTVPEEQALRVAWLRARLLEAPATSARWRQRLALTLGQTSNANNGALSREFILTPAGLSPVLVQLSADQRPHPDSFLQLRYEVARREQIADDHVRRLFFQLQGREFARVHDFALADAHLGREDTFRLNADTDLTLAATLRHVRLGGDALATTVAAAAGLARRLPVMAGWQCDLLLRPELEYRHDARSGFDNSRLAGLQAGSLCARERWQAGVLVRQAREQVLGQRPGGNQRRKDWLVPLRFMLRDDLKLEFNWARSQLNDSEGYSPLLEAGAVREVRRSSQRLQLDWVAPPSRWAGLVWQLAWERLRDRSNLALFSQEADIVSVTGQVDF